MDDRGCVQFLQWSLPRLGLRWRGFRKVRRQVCRRIVKHCAEINLSTFDEYRAYLERNPDEWAILDRLCRVTISRFYRNNVVFEFFSSDIFPALLQTFQVQGSATIRVWSGGCASGEEPYTIALIWYFLFRKAFPNLSLEIIGTDIDPVTISRAEVARYKMSSLRELPITWISKAFEKNDEFYLLNTTIKQCVRFIQLDIRSQAPSGKFHVVLCRNLAFTYFNPEIQQQVLRTISAATENQGVLITGTHESITPGESGYTQWVANLPIYQKTGMPN